MAENPMPPPPIVSSTPWARVVLWLGLFFMFIASGLYVFQSCRDIPADVIRHAGNALADVASAFKRGGTITTTFASFATSVTNTQFFQFATLKQNEIFTRTEEPSIGIIPLPDVVVEARAPVEYTYFLDLNEPWRLLLKDGTIYVYVPPIHYNKPAVDASGITYEVRKGYLKSSVAMENLKKSITSMVDYRAKESIPLIKEGGRKQVTEFVERWLAKSFSDGKRYPVRIYFPDEKPENDLSVKGPLN